MTFYLHPYVRERVDRLLTDTTAQVDAWKCAQELIDSLALNPLFDVSRSVYCNAQEVDDVNTGETIFLHRVTLMFYIDSSHKTLLRPYLLEALDNPRFPTWDKRYTTEKCYSGPRYGDYELHEIWTAELDHIEQYHAPNRITIHFCGPVQVGMKLPFVYKRDPNTGERVRHRCTVKLHTDEPISTTRMQIACAL